MEVEDGLVGEVAHRIEPRDGRDRRAGACGQDGAAEPEPRLTVHQDRRFRVEPGVAEEDVYAQRREPGGGIHVADLRPDPPHPFHGHPEVSRAGRCRATESFRRCAGLRPGAGRAQDGLGRHAAVVQAVAAHAAPLDKGDPRAQQRCCGRGHDSARRGVGHELECQGAADYVVTVPALETALAGPLFPPPQRLLHLPLCRFAEGRHHGRLLQVERQRQVAPLTRAQRGPAPDARPVRRERSQRQLTPQQQARLLAEPEPEGAAILGTGGRPAVSRARVALDLDLHIAVQAFELAQDLVVRPQLPALVGLGRHRHEVHQTELASSRPEGGFQHVRITHVPPAGLVLAGRPDREAAPRRRSRSAAKTAGLSKRGRQSQSSEPSREMSAADRQSPMTA
jgi:hypothetical protein